jgi:hypothetical protein
MRQSGSGEFHQADLLFLTGKDDPDSVAGLLSYRSKKFVWFEARQLKVAEYDIGKDTFEEGVGFIQGPAETDKMWTPIKYLLKKSLM